MGLVVGTSMPLSTLYTPAVHAWIRDERIPSVWLVSLCYSLCYVVAEDYRNKLSTKNDNLHTIFFIRVITYNCCGNTG